MIRFIFTRASDSANRRALVLMLRLLVWECESSISSKLYLDFICLYHKHTTTGAVKESDILNSKNKSDHSAKQRPSKHNILINNRPPSLLTCSDSEGQILQSPVREQRRLQVTSREETGGGGGGGWRTENREEWFVKLNCLLLNQVASYSF